MPELPEVEVVRRGLGSHVVGRVFASVDIFGQRAARRHPPGPDHLAQLLSGARVVEADRRGKYLWLVLDRDSGSPEWPRSPFALVVHLGMSGQMLVESPEAPLERHAHAVFSLAGQRSDEPDRHLRFIDQRTFGGLAVSALSDPATGHPHGVPTSIAHIAPDPLEEAFEPETVVRRVRASSSGVKRLLLNQNVVSGVGNIYADEALWRARLHGERPGSVLTRPAVRRLLGHVQQVMEESLLMGGTSFDALYVDVEGAGGSNLLSVYGREGRPCTRCDTPIVRERFMNRSSHFCPVCQRKR